MIPSFFNSKVIPHSSSCILYSNTLSFEIQYVFLSKSCSAVVDMNNLPNGDEHYSIIIHKNTNLTTENESPATITI